jgi:hypothetical protein
LECNSEQSFLRGPCQDVIRKKTGARVQRVVRESEKREDLGGAVSNEMSMEAEESPLLQAVTRERPVKALQTKKT